MSYAPRLPLGGTRTSCPGKITGVRRAPTPTVAGLDYRLFCFRVDLKDNEMTPGFAKLVLALAVFIYYARCMQLIAQKTGTQHAWLAWIPGLNLILMVWIAGRSLWWLFAWYLGWGVLYLFRQGILLVISVVIFWIILHIGVAEARGKPRWMGLLMCIPLINLVVWGYLAFWKEQAEQSTRTNA